jgi:uncharacterized protein (TIGR04141 family)
MANKTLTLHLAKSDVVEFNQLLSEQALERVARNSTRIVEDESFGGGARLYVFVGDNTVPSWLRDIRSVFNVPAQIQNSSSCAVLAFRTAGRIFASTFAHGWMFLQENNIEGDFGLRVALNALDDKKLKGLERANLGDALRGVSLSPFQRDFTSFGLDDALDLVRRISGNTREDTSADAMSGSRSLKVTGEYTLRDLPQIAEEALGFYRSTDYRNSTFRVIDFVTPVIDRRLASILDSEAANSIREGSEDFELGLPLKYEDDNLTYKFAGPGLRGRYPDLLLRHYVAALGDKLQDIDPEILRSHKIVAISDDPSRPSRNWSVRAALVGSIIYEQGRYAINEGEWYKIDEAFKLSIEDNFISLIEGWEAPPVPLRKIYDEHGTGQYQSEASYNTEVAAAQGLVLLDTHLITIPGIQRSGFEPCDLLDIEGKRFIHVKKSSRRSTVLSHFFKQASNSAQQFSRFPAAWDQLINLATQIGGQQAAEQLRAAIEDDTRAWKVELIIADAPRATGEFNIPFFSKISLRDEAISLHAMNYRVGLRFIGLEPDDF